MTELSQVKRNVHEEETKFRAPVSENTMQKFGQAVNFINYRQHSEKQFFINGSYNYGTIPVYGVDGMVFFEFDAEIIDTWFFIMQAGTSGYTEVDIKRCQNSGGTWTSIYSSKPQIYSTAGSFAYIGENDPAGGGRIPGVRSVTNVNAGDALRIDLMNAQSGPNVEGCGIIIHYRPR